MKTDHQTEDQAAAARLLQVWDEALPDLRPQVRDQLEKLRAAMGSDLASQVARFHARQANPGAAQEALRDLVQAPQHALVALEAHALDLALRALGSWLVLRAARLAAEQVDGAN